MQLMMPGSASSHPVCTAQEVHKTEEPAWAAGADVADKVQAPLEQAPPEEVDVPGGEEDVPATEEAALAGSEPPEVRVLVNGVQTGAAKPGAEAEKAEPVNLHIEPVRFFSGTDLVAFQCWAMRCLPLPS